MYRRDLLKGASAAIGGAALLAADSAIAERRTARSGAANRVGPYIETRDGTQLFYRDWGTGAPLVFISGWALTSESWAYQMAPLSESGLRCIAYDRRGHGRSSDPGRGFDYDTLADDLAAVLDALDLQNVTLVTHSMAGGEAVRYLSRYGSKRVARVALIGATLPFLTKTADNPDGIDPAVFENGRRNVLMRDFPKALRDNLRPFVVPETSQALLDWIEGLMLQCSMKALIDCNKALAATDFRAEVAKINVPTLIVHGDKDVSAPLALSGRKTAALLPNAIVKIYEGAPHGLLYTHTERLNKDLQEFVAT
ncbi:MAG TPA: alpha/beta hydrolase [Steroidobacteraceae bacterium]|nr:alpha/beta hydrolase [Steroidobacteraceae bacterium]